MILVYRPELDNPPMDKECTIGFSFIGAGANTESIQIAAGVTRGFPEAVWERIKDYEVVKRLLSLGALRVDVDVPEDAEAPAATTDSIADLPLSKALELVESSLDLNQLQRWDAKEQRIRLKNAIAKRMTAITEGNG
jgi:hypothetical protein